MDSSIYMKKIRRDLSNTLASILQNFAKFNIRLRSIRNNQRPERNTVIAMKAKSPSDKFTA
jgi:nucleoid DNA-binding protein